MQVQETYRAHHLVENALNKAKIALVNAVGSSLVVSHSFHDTSQLRWRIHIFFVHSALQEKNE